VLAVVTAALSQKLDTPSVRYIVNIVLA
jgi:hypothetical protein